MILMLSYLVEYLVLSAERFRLMGLVRSYAVFYIVFLLNI